MFGSEASISDKYTAKFDSSTLCITAEGLYANEVTCNDTMLVKRTRKYKYDNTTGVPNEFISRNSRR